MTRLRVALVGPLFADAEAAILASLVRDRFVFEPNETVYRAAPLSFTASIDVGASF